MNPQANYAPTRRRLSLMRETLRSLSMRAGNIRAGITQKDDDKGDKPNEDNTKPHETKDVTATCANTCDCTGTCM